MDQVSNGETVYDIREESEDDHRDDDHHDDDQARGCHCLVCKETTHDDSSEAHCDPAKPPNSQPRFFRFQKSI